MNTIIKPTAGKQPGSGKLLFFAFLVLAFSYAACSKENDNEPESPGFVLTSPDIQKDSLLPVEYTCDGASATLPLAWGGFPEGTRCFALIMHHEASPTDIHWYWVLYNIPLSVQSLEKNSTGTGTLGTNSVNGQNRYAPPCSKGPGAKQYIYTVYALSEPVSLNVPDSTVNRAVLLNAIKNITIASASLTVVYSRDV